jgi:hypothetical protein
VSAKRLAIAIAAGVTLGGCCHDGFGYSHSNALAQFHPTPKPHFQKWSKPPTVSRNAAKPKEISANEDELSDSANAELRKKLVICRGCEDPPTNDPPKAVWPNSSVSNLTVDQVTTLFPGRPALRGRDR